MQAAFFQGVRLMQQLGFHSRICVHGRRQDALKPGQKVGALEKFTVHSGKLFDA